MSLPVPNMQSDELSACKGCLLAKTGCTVNEGTGDIAEVPRRGSSAVKGKGLLFSQSTNTD